MRYTWRRVIVSAFLKRVDMEGAKSLQYRFARFRPAGWPECRDLKSNGRRVQIYCL